MASSMTAFTRVQKQVDTGILCWEIKSVNHRYLDISFRLPDSLRFLENHCRVQLRETVSRGKVECQLKSQMLAQHALSFQINEDMLASLMSAGDKLAAQKQLPNDLTLSSVLTLPGVAQWVEPDPELLSQQAMELFQEALNQLLAARQKEGQALISHVESRLQKLQSELSRARELAKPLTEQRRDKLAERLQAFQVDVDAVRFEQELVLLLARLDITEELDRLQTHADEVARVLLSEEANGRRLDFLMQELNREANTLSSKSDSIALTQSAVEMKVLIEQMREQIQNIE